MMTTQPIQIQPLRAEDVPACVRVLTENDLWRLYGTTAQGAEQMFTSALADGANIIVAKLNGQTAGFAWCNLQGAFDRSAYLRLIGVLPEFQRLGVGERLLQVVEMAASRDVKDIFLLVTDTNTSAQQFYVHLGYKQIGAIPDYVVNGISELIFYKRLQKN